MSHDNQIRTELDQALDENERLRIELEQLRRPDGAVDAEQAAMPMTSSRRKVIQLAGAAMGGAVVASLAGADPAVADDPNDVVKNTSNAVTAATGLVGNFAAEVLRVENTSAAGSSRAIYGRGGAVDVGAIRGDNLNDTGIGGVGVSGFAPGGRDFLAFGSGRIGMNSHSFSTVDNSYTTGELHQSNGTLYCMVASTTRRAIVTPVSAGAFVPIDPVRVYDSRSPQPTPGEIAAGQDRVVSIADARDPDTGAVADADAVPAGATAIVFNLTITGTTGAGFLSVASGTATSSSASLINWSTGGTTIANASTVRVSPPREIKVFCGGAGTTHFIVDVSGYYL